MQQTNLLFSSHIKTPIDPVTETVTVKKILKKSPMDGCYDAKSTEDVVVFCMTRKKTRFVNEF